MKVSAFQKIASALVISLGAIATALPAQAGILINGWNYARDDYSYDGSDGGNYNVNSKYDIYGIGTKQVGDEIWVAINASTPLTGISYSGAANNNIGWGDLFLDFNYGKAGNDFATAQGSMLGIRFAGTNDSGAGSTGVYTGVSAKSVATLNSGFSTLNSYAKNVKDKSKHDAVIGDLAVNNAYYAPYAKYGVPNVINTFNSRIGDVTALSATDLSDLPGLNLASNHATKFGFKFSRPLGYSGDFLGSLFLECINDSVAIKGNIKPVPVPPAIAGILAAGALGGWRAARRKKQLKAVAA